MEQHLATTNILLGIMAAVSLLEGLLLLGVGVAGFVIYRRIVGMLRLLDGFEQRQIAPLMVHVHSVIDDVNAVIGDVKGVTAKVREETERVDYAIRTTIDRVDDTADRVRGNVRDKTRRVVGIMRGVRAAIEGILRSREEPSAGASGY